MGSEQEIYVVAGEYHPYRVWGFKNPKFNEASGRMLDLKDEKDRKHPVAIRYFGQFVANALRDHIHRKSPILVGIVPGHKMDSLSPGLRAIVSNHVRPAFNIVNKRNPLRRHTDTKKRANGGDRSAANIFDTVEVVEGIITPGSTVVLLDDVTTTGTSLKACAELLKRAGAERVLCIALMNTVHD